MTSADLKFFGSDDEAIWPELSEKLRENPNDVIQVGGMMRVVVIESGMASGLPSMMLRWDLEDGRVVVAELSARLWNVIAHAVVARYPAVEDD